MKRSDGEARYNILSGRFSDQENKEFRAVAKKKGISLSQMVREALLEWKAAQTVSEEE